MIQSYPDYSQTPESRWFSELPSHWESSKAKWVFSNEKHRASEADEQLAASQKYGVVPQKLMIEMNNANVMLALKGTDNFKQVIANDFVISLRSFEGGIEHSAYDGCISPAYTVLRLRDSEVEPAYFKYALKCPPFIAALNSTSEGIRDGKTITYDEFGELLIALPPVDEQKAISAYLNSEITRIDSLVEEKQNFIDLLKEKRQALISHFVTKGLDANVPMKDSGVEWIGEVPEHWDTCLIKHKVKSITDGAHISPVTENGKHYFVSIRDLNEDEIDFPNSLLTDEDSYQYLVHTGCQPRAGDLLFSKDGTVGKTIVTPADKDFVVASSLVIFRKDETKSDPDFLNFLCKSNSVQEQVNMFVRGAALRRVSIANLNKVWGTFPPVSEQEEIAQAIKRKIRPLDELQTETRQSIELLKEHRTALISAAVTGKIDVRGLVDTKGVPA